MVLVIIGILCLYYYRGMGSRFNGQGQERNEKKESAYTTLGRDLGASGTSITGKPDSRIIDRHKAGETNHLGNISILLKAYYSEPGLVSLSVYVNNVTRDDVSSLECGQQKRGLMEQWDRH